MGWESTLKAFQSRKNIVGAYDELYEAVQGWADSNLSFLHNEFIDEDNLKTLGGRLKNILNAINGGETDLEKQFLKLYEYAEQDDNVKKLGRILYNMLKWQERNQ